MNILGNKSAPSKGKRNSIPLFSSLPRTFLFAAAACKLSWGAGVEATALSDVCVTDTAAAAAAREDAAADFFFLM